MLSGAWNSRATVGMSGAPKELMTLATSVASTSTGPNQRLAPPLASHHAPPTRRAPLCHPAARPASRGVAGSRGTGTVSIAASSGGRPAARGFGAWSMGMGPPSVSACDLHAITLRFIRADRTYHGGMAHRGLARDLEQALGQLMLRRNRSALYDAILDSAPPGVDRQTYSVLSGLARLGPQSAARLADELGIDRSGASRYADRLQNAGLLERGPDPRDGRATLLSLTPAGQAAVAELRDALTRHLASRIADWPEGQAQALIDGIHLLIDPPPG